ncbi:MAG TPA: flagellar brake protein [candidate division Zixibacteria bacterium]|nr:flagellar brake protein [candidate division Zixibacteria bacterium]
MRYLTLPDERFESRVEDSDDRRLYISQPDRRQRIHYGQRVEVSFVREGGVYTFDACVDSLVRSGRHLVTLQPTSGVRHRQRRGAVRVEMRLDLSVAPIRRPVARPIEPAKLQWEPTQTMNFSSSGALVRTTRNCIVGDLLVAQFDRKRLTAAPKYILASWRRMFNAGELTYMGIEFIRRETVSDFLLPEELPHITPELLELNDVRSNAFSKFVFDYELKQRQLGAS